MNSIEEQPQIVRVLGEKVKDQVINILLDNAKDLTASEVEKVAGNVVEAYFRSMSEVMNNRAVGKKIAEDLFSNGQQQVAKSLRVQLFDGSDGGGWGKDVVAKRIAARLNLEETYRLMDVQHFMGEESEKADQQAEADRLRARLVRAEAEIPSGSSYWG